MTDGELNAWRMIGADIGLEFDELGHPYRTGPARDVDGSTYDGCFDWRPLENDSDSVGLILHYRMMVVCQLDCVMVRDFEAQILAITFYRSEYCQEAALRRAVFDAAASLVRQKLADLDRSTSVL